MRAACSACAPRQRRVDAALSSVAALIGACACGRSMAKVIKTLSGHTGGVRELLVLGLEIWMDRTMGRCGSGTRPSASSSSTLRRRAVRSYRGTMARSTSCSRTATAFIVLGRRHNTLLVAGRTPRVYTRGLLNGGPIYQIAHGPRRIGRVLERHAALTRWCHPGAERTATARACGFINGLCQLQARTTRQCWSFATSDGKVCRWKSEELEPQHTPSARAFQRRSSLAEQMRIEYEERKAEQVRHAEEVHAGAEALAQSEVMLEEAREAQKQLLQELANSMDVQERDVREAERLRGELRARDADLSSLREQHAELEAVSAQAIGELEVRASTAEAEASLRAAELAEEVARNEQREAASAKRQMSAERLARKLLSSYVPQVRENLERRRERNEYLLTQELTRAGDPWVKTLAVHNSRGGEEFGSPAIVPQQESRPTVATSLDEMMGTGESPTRGNATVANSRRRRRGMRRRARKSEQILFFSSLELSTHPPPRPTRTPFFAL